MTINDQDANPSTKSNLISAQIVKLMPNTKLPPYERFGTDCPDHDLMEFCRRHDRVMNLKWDVPVLSTRYDITYTQKVIPLWIPVREHYDFPEHTELMCTLTYYEDGSAGTSLRFDERSHLHSGWVANKMGINTRDADGLLLFLEQFGHSVHYADPDTINEAKKDLNYGSTFDTPKDALAAVVALSMLSDDDGGEA